MNFKFPNIDLFSFWFGFVLASLFWLILLQLVKLIPRMRKSASENRLKRQEKKALDREYGLRLFALRRAQNAHLASSLFPLEKILIEPSVITPARFLPPTDEEFGVNALYRILPDTPETPELVADFPVIKNSLLTLLQAGQKYISISAESGFGKTTALAALTSQLCSVNPSARMSSYLPIFIDYLEIDHDHSPADAELVNFLSMNIRGLSTSIVDQILHHADSQNRLVIMVDNLDCLPLAEFNIALKWIKELQVTYPKTFILTTNDPFINGELRELGFEIFALASWSQAEKISFFKQWGDAWLSLKLDETQKQKTERTLHWLLQEEPLDSPFELTLRSWLAFSGLFDESEITNVYADSLKLFSGGWLTTSCTEALVKAAKINPYPTLSQVTALEIIDRDLTQNADLFSSQLRAADTNHSAGKNSGESVRSSNKILDILIKNHLLTVLPDENLRFTSLKLFAVLAAKVNSDLAFPALEEISQSPVIRQLFAHKQISQSDFYTIDSMLTRADGVLRRDHFFTLSWLESTNSGDPLREKIFRQTARLLQEKALPIGLRYRFLNELVKTHDPSIPSLFTFFSTSPDPAIRQISALGLGLLHDDKYVPILVKLSRDSSADVQKVAIISLNGIWTQNSQSALVDIIFSAEDSIRSLGCELLSIHLPEGHQLLQEITSTDNYLARKAAIYGLVHIQEPWVPALLEKLSTEDTQWIVRDAAKFALEHPFVTDTFVLTRPIPVLENPWTLQKAETYNMVLPSQGIPADLLFAVLNKDTIPNKEIALGYLISQPTPELIDTLRAISADWQSDFRDEALNALFGLGKRGFNLSTTQK